MHTSTKWLLGILIAVIIIAAGFFGWLILNSTIKTPQPIVQTAISTPSPEIFLSTPISVSPTPIASSNSKIYANQTYGFSMTFPTGWEGYKMKEMDIPGEIATYYVNLPTKFPASPEGDSTADKGYFSPFVISVYTLDQWNATQKDEGPKDTLIIKNSKYAFAWTHAQWVPEDFKNDKDINSIITSFKLN